MSYVGEAVMCAVPGAAWRRGYHRVRAYAHQNRPVLARGDEEVAVSPMLFGIARSHLREPGGSPDDQWIIEDREVLVASGTIDPAVLKRWIVTELTRTAIAGG